MSINEHAVAQHYGKGGLFDRLMTTLEAAGADTANLSPGDLEPYEEFHIGGRDGTVYATQKMDLGPDNHVLDIGCGIGGAARYMALEYGSRITGIDLTPEYVEVAKALNGKLGMDDNPLFATASALDLPYGDESFDKAITMHVAMNIQDRATLYFEVARVLQPGSIFLVYDMMKKGAEPVVYPVPWAETAETSHLTTPDEMVDLLKVAGFEILEIEDRVDFARDVFAKGRALAAQATKPAGPHVIMGGSGLAKMKNIRANIEEGRVAPTQIVARKAG